MPTYSEISDEWFYLLLPRGRTLESFEAEEGLEDRKKTRTVFEQMERELPVTLREELRIRRFDYSVDTLEEIDEALTTDRIASWIRMSDPDDPNNTFKLTLSELSVYFGNLLKRENNGEWRHARFPNFFQSSVIVKDVAFHVFDTLMKRCSSDRPHETLTSKWQTFQALIAGSDDGRDPVS